MDVFAVEDNIKMHINFTVNFSFKLIKNKLWDV